MASALLLVLAMTWPAGGVAAKQTATAIPIQQFGYQPASLQVAVGTTVVWTNEDAVAHSVTHGPSGAPGGAFDSGLFDQGGSFSFTFAEPGAYPYFCSLHQFMVGEVQVVL